MSVCNGAPLLAESGILDGLQATTHRDWIDWMAGRYPAVGVLNDVRLVDTGHVVTSAGISAGIDLALHLVERLHGAHTAAWTARSMEHLWSDQYRNVFESSADAIVIVDQDGRIALTNTTACKLFGYASDGMVGMHVAALAPPELQGETVSHFLAVPLTGSAEIRSVGQRRDSTRFHAELRSTTFEYHGVPHVLSMIRDITSRVEAEEAVLEERQRLSRELHDSVSQALYGIILGAQTARAMAERDPTQVIEPLDYVVSLAQTGLAEMRALIFALRPEALEQVGLVAALSRRSAALEARHQVRLEVALGEEPNVPLPIKEALFRIAQEAMQNTIKHARATVIHLSLANVAGTLVLHVRDDGIGFDPSGSFPGHLGLQSMRERASEFGGTLELESAVGMGTSITVRVPVGVGVAAAKVAQG
jgi:PAS domain S-box-containing protein